MWISSAFAMVAAAHLPKRSFSKAFGDMHNTLVSAAFRTLTLQAHAAYIYVHSTEDSLINTTKLSSAHARPSEGSPGWQVYPTSECNRPKIKRHVQCIPEPHHHQAAAFAAGFAAAPLALAFAPAFFFFAFNPDCRPFAAASYMCSAHMSNL